MTSTSQSFVIIIVNSIEPYCFEINNVLAMPSGFTYRFRYQRKKQGEWMPEIANPKELNNCRALVVLRDFFVTAQLIPIRKIYITSILIIGDIVYIEYLLEERIAFNSNPDKRDKQIEKFNQRIVTDIKTNIYPNIPGQDLKNLVFFGTDYTYDFVDDEYKGDKADEDSNRWGNLIEVIGTFNNTGIEVFKDFDFIKINGITDENSNPAKLITNKNRLFFLIKNRKLYSLQFLQRTYTGRQATSAVIQPRDIVLTTDANAIRLVTSRLNILGKYDLLKFFFSPEISSLKKNTFLMLQFYRGSEALPFPSILIPMQIRYSFWENIITSSSLIIFCLASITYWFAEIIVPASYVQALRNVLLPVMIVFGGEVLRTIKDFILTKISS
jgi:hypothetical protein